jgi:hypothetical protein
LRRDVNYFPDQIRISGSPEMTAPLIGTSSLHFPIARSSTSALASPDQLADPAGDGLGGHVEEPAAATILGQAAAPS